MKHIPYSATDAQIFPRIAQVAKSGTFDGSSDSDYLQSCRWFVERYECVIVLTRDVGYHTSGWWKNPDYERCYHLSISFPGGRSKQRTERILERFFGNNRRMLWCEPPYSEAGKRFEVFHYRLFCDEQWNPLFPRGEVYSKQFTEQGWKSYSEIHDRKF